MPDFTEIKVRLIFDYPSGSIPSREVVKCISHCEDAAYDSESLDIRHGRLLFPEDSWFMLDAMLYRLDSGRGQILRLEDASKGSVELLLSVVPAALWILEHTVGETVKAAWLESEMHQKLKETFLARLDHKPEEIAERTKHRINEDPEMSVNVETETSGLEQSTAIVTVRVSPKFEEQQIPQLVQFLP